jgi:protein-S-isoprenylcysteine O-methyltransferase Ste14
MTLLFLSLGILVNSLWIVALLVPVTVWLWWRVVPAEEAYLLRAFGQDYLNYQAEVRRWI